MSRKTSEVGVFLWLNGQVQGPFGPRALNALRLEKAVMNETPAMLVGNSDWTTLAKVNVDRNLQVDSGIRSHEMETQIAPTSFPLVPEPICLSLVGLLYEFGRDAFRIGVNGYFFRILALILAFVIFFIAGIIWEMAGWSEAHIFQKAHFLRHVFPFLYKTEDPGPYTNFLAWSLAITVGVSLIGFIYNLFRPIAPAEVAQYAKVAKAASSGAFGLVGGAGTLAGVTGTGEFAGETVAMGATAIYFVPGVTFYAPPFMYLYWLAYGAIGQAAVASVFMALLLVYVRGGLVLLLWTISWFYDLGTWSSGMFRGSRYWAGPWEHWSGIMHVKDMDVLVAIILIICSLFVPICLAVLYSGLQNHIILGRGLCSWLLTWRNPQARAAYRMDCTEALRQVQAEALNPPPEPLPPPLTSTPSAPCDPQSTNERYTLAGYILACPLMGWITATMFRDEVPHASWRTTALLFVTGTVVTALCA